MSDFETPIMRDLSKLVYPILLGMLFFIGIFFLFLFPYSVTVYGPHCTVQTSYSFAQYVWEQLTISC